MTEMYFLFFLSFLSHSVSLCVHGCVHTQMHVEEREQFFGVESSGLVAGTFTHYLQP